MIAFATLILGLGLDTLNRMPLPETWAEARFLTAFAVQGDRLWCLDPFGARVLSWDLKTGKDTAMDIAYRADTTRRVRPLGLWVSRDRLFITHAPLPLILVYDDKGRVLDTLRLESEGCALYPLAYPVIRPDGGFWIYADRWTKALGYDYWLHYYSPDGQYIASHFPMSNYATEASLARFLGITGHFADLDAEGGLWACEPCSYLLWHFSASGALLGVMGVPPEDYRLPKPVPYSKAHGDTAMVREIYRTWDANTDLFTGVFVAGKYILAKFVRVRPGQGRQILTQVYGPDGSPLGTLELAPKAADQEGRIYVISDDTLCILRLR